MHVLKVACEVIATLTSRRGRRGSAAPPRRSRLQLEHCEDRSVPATPVLSVHDAQVVEPDSGTRVALVRVTLSEPSPERVVLYWTTADGTAKPGADFVAARGRLDFLPGETAKTIAVSVVGDRVAEPVEALSVNVGSPLNVSVPDRYAKLTIVDNDGGTSAARRVFAQDFENPSNPWQSGANGFIPDARPPAERTLQKVVPVAGGGHALRMNLAKGVYDPQIGGWTSSTNYARYARVGIDAGARGVGTELYMRYDLRFDAGVQIESGTSMKFNWFNGVRTRANDQFNYFTRFTPDGTFAFINNHPPGVSVGEDYTGDAALRAKGQIRRFADAPGAAALLQGRSFWDWWRGRTHTVEVYMHLNDPGQANGTYRLVIDGVTVLDFSNGRFRNRGNDTFGEVNPVGMYGGPTAPTRSFGLTLDNVQVWTGVPGR